MATLLNYSINLSANNIDIDSLHSSTGEVVYYKDSVAISYDDLRLVNSKLIELEYEKQINNNLRSIIHNDSIIIKNYKYLNEKLSKDCKKAIKRKNIELGGVTAIFIITVITLLIK